VVPLLVIDAPAYAEGVIAAKITYDFSEDNGNFYYHYNPIGNTILLTDEFQKIVASYQYDAYGNYYQKNKSKTTIYSP